MKMHRRTAITLALAAGATLASTGALAQNNVLRVVPHSNLAIDHAGAPPGGRA